MPDHDVTLRLHEGGLRDLLAGDWVYRVWLTEEEPGVYRLHTRSGGPGAEAMIRALQFGDPVSPGEPPFGEPSPDVAKSMAWWEQHFADIWPKAG